MKISPMNSVTLASALYSYRNLLRDESLKQMQSIHFMCGESVVTELVFLEQLCEELRKYDYSKEFFLTLSKEPK